MVNEGVGLQGHKLLLHVEISDSDLLHRVYGLDLDGGASLECLDPSVKVLTAVCRKCQNTVSPGMFHLG